MLKHLTESAPIIVTDRNAVYILHFNNRTIPTKYYRIFRVFWALFCFDFILFDAAFGHPQYFSLLKSLMIDLSKLVEKGSLNDISCLVYQLEC